MEMLQKNEKNEWEDIMSSSSSQEFIDTENGLVV